MQTRKLYIIGGCVAGLVVLAVVGLFAAVTGTWMWIASDGSLRRAQSRSEIARHLEVAVLSVEIVAASADAGSAEHQVVCRVRVANVGDQPITGFSGTVLLTDARGWTAFQCGHTESSRLGAHTTVETTWHLDCVKGSSPHFGAEGSLKGDWVDEQVSLEDGTRIDAFSTDPASDLKRPG